MNRKKEMDARNGEEQKEGTRPSPSREDIERINALVDFDLRHKLNGEIENWWDYWALDEFAASEGRAK